MYNLDVRLKIKENRLCHYEVAKEMGVTEFTFCKWLREEMSKEKKESVLSAIDRLIGKPKQTEKEIIDRLIELGYPNNFQHESKWVVDYCYKISDIVKDCLELRNKETK